MRLLLSAVGLCALGLCALPAAPAAGATAPYVPKQPALSTPWTHLVSTTLPLPDYPRPQLRRTAWLNLNGQWQYEQAQVGQPPPFGQSLAQTILVPFPVQSPLSGIERGDQLGWYRRTFQVPPSWNGRHVLLHFGAVSWAASVYVNGRMAGTHRGDYDPFSLDITRLLRLHGTNELVVGFENPIGGAGEPVGKQIPGVPVNIYHTASSGIWQTVWMEPVSSEHVAQLDLTPDLNSSSLRVLADATGGRGVRVLADALAKGRVVAHGSGRAGRTFSLHIAQPRLWSPSDPFLYTLQLRLVARGRVLDRVSSYFGMRSISLGRAGGHVRLMLNGHFVFETGALDQGFWPDGVYTAPTDAALRFDIEAAMRLGYDMVRKHVKVEPDRWYYWADRLGILVWQDMPNMPVVTLRAPTPPAELEFRRELGAIVRALRSHPSIVTWTPFNEGWGQFDVTGVTREVKQLDPSLLVNAQSGGANCCSALESPASDIRDAHLYDGPFAVPSDHRASVIGEYGGVFSLPPPGDRWPGVLTTVGSATPGVPASAVQQLLKAQYADLAQEMRTRGLSGSVYTELAGYEQELGILTYDRRAFTVDPAVLRRLNDSLIAASKTVGAGPPARPRIPPGTTGLWRFDAGQGSVAADGSGHGHALMLEGGAGWTRGRLGSALSIGAVGQQAVASGPLIDTGGSFTVSAWLSSRRAAQSGTAVSEHGTDGSAFSLGIDTAMQGVQSLTGLAARHLPLTLGTATWWTFVVPAGDQCNAFQCAIPANMRYDDGRYDPRTGTWHYVTGVYDGGTQTISIYVDGIPEDVEHVGGLPPAQGPLTVGAGLGDYGPPDTFVGAIDQLRTYARALSPNEVWELYRAKG